MGQNICDIEIEIKFCGDSSTIQHKIPAHSGYSKSVVKSEKKYLQKYEKKTKKKTRNIEKHETDQKNHCENFEALNNLKQASKIPFPCLLKIDFVTS